MSTPTLVWVQARPAGRSLLSLILVVAFGLSVLAVVGDPVAGSGGVDAAREVLASLPRTDLSPPFLRTVAEATLLTAAYAVAAMTVALAVGIPGALAVSGVLVRRRTVRVASVSVFRSLFATVRAIHELVWALLLLIVLGPNPIAGVIAIGLPYGATVARVLGERLTDVSAAPLAALASAGSSPWQTLFYGRLPLAGSDLAGYLFYRFECAVRAAAVLSFIGLGGIGFQIQIALADLRFERVWPLIGALLVLVVGVDRLSRYVREAGTV